jgi:hypothetical protein
MPAVALDGVKSALRSVGSVIVGYLVFALCAYAFFRLSGQAPHQPAPVPIMIIGVVLGMVFAAAGGYVAAWLGGRHPLGHAVAVAAVLALGASVSLVATLGKGVVWTQLAALLLMAPCAVVGGWLRSTTTRIMA